MRIAIDMQSRQTVGSRDRGIGRYSLSLARAMLEVGGAHEFVLVANSGLGALEGVRSDFGLGSQSKDLKVFCSLPNTDAYHPENSWRRKASELLRETYLNSLGVDMVHTTSLFEGFMDGACSSIHSWPGASSQAVTLYDLIPYVFKDTYLASAEVRAWYYERLGQLRRADLLLAISEFSARDAIAHLGLNDSIVVNVSGAADPHFAPMQVHSDHREQMLARYGLGEFIMYTGGIDHRKNVDALVRAYAQLPVTLVQKFQLAIVCKVAPGDRAYLAQLAHSLGLAADRIVITGFVPEADLVTLCNMCEAFVFPSWYEGFGLPVLEAMQCGAAVIAANASSVPEIVGRSDALFDPFDETSISRKVQHVLEDSAFRDELRAHGLSRARKFTWRDSARRAIEAMEEVHAVRSPRKLMVSVASSGSVRPTLAYVSPLPPERSGIADYSRDLLPFLAKHYEITLVNVSGETTDSYLCANMPVRDVGWLRRHSERFDRIVYQFGNSTFHSHMFDLLNEIPGAVVLHDFWLSGIAEHLDGHGQRAGFWNEALYASHGWRAVLDRQLLGSPAAAAKWPASGGVVGSATGVIVHSQRSRDLLRKYYGEQAYGKSAVVPLVRIVPPILDKALAAQRLGYGAGTRILCAFGFIHETKYSLETLEAFLKSSIADDPAVRLVLVGEVVGGEHTEFGRTVLDLVKRSKGKVIVTGFVEQAEYALYLQAAEAAIQLRRGSRGETSAGALDCLASGVALLVNANPAFSQIPRPAIMELPESFDDDQLVGAIDSLMLQSPERDARVRAGLEYLKVECAPSRIAMRYRDAIESFDSSSARVRVARLCASVASIDAVVVPDAQDIAAAAKAIRVNLPLQQPGRCFLDAAIADRLGGEEIRRLVTASGDAACQIDLVAYDRGRLRNARAAMSSLLGFDAGLPDMEVQPAAGVTYVLDLQGVMDVAGSGQPHVDLIDQLDPINASIWFLCDQKGLDSAGLGVLGRLAGIATGFLVVGGPEHGPNFQKLELALSNAGRDDLEVRFVAPGDARALIAATQGDGGIGLTVLRSCARVWEAGHPELGSQVGQLRNGALASAGKEGFLMFGPYASAPAGRYRLAVYGTVPEGRCGSAWYDATSERGQTPVLPAAPLGSTNAGVVAEAEFELPGDVNDLEVRIWVDGRDDIAVQAFALSRV